MTVVDTQDAVRQSNSSMVDGAYESISLLGPMVREMRLKVSNDENQTSRVVELHARKCRVGSASECDLRVDDPGVAPFECLIFQGTQNNVVRWLTGSSGPDDAEFFQDEVLRAGDSIQIGPVELELLVDELLAAEEVVEPDEQPPLPQPAMDEGRLAEYLSRLERLESQLELLRDASESNAIASSEHDSSTQVVATVNDLVAQLSELQSRSMSDRDLWSGEKAQLESLLESRLQDFDRLQDEVQHLRDALETVRSEYGNLTSNNDADERLLDLSQELAEQSNGFEQKQQSWELERAELQLQLQQNMDRLERFEVQLAGQNERQAESEAACRAAEERADRLQQSVDELSNQLAEQQEKYATARAEWEAERTTLESDLVHVKEAFAESKNLPSAELHADKTSDTWRCEPNAPRSTLDLANGEDELREPVEMPHHEPLDPVPYTFDSRPDEYMSDSPYESTDEDALSGLQIAAFSDRAESDFSTESHLTDLTESNNDVQAYEAPREASAALVKVDFESAPADPPVSTAEVVARMGQAEIWNPDETETETDESPVSPLSDASVPRVDSVSRAVSSEPPEPLNGQAAEASTSETSLGDIMADPANATNDEEESIEEYMARLMNRVRASDQVDDTPRTSESSAERSPVTEYVEAKPTPAPKHQADLETIHADEYKPRTQAPEMVDRMTAMRSLSNDSHRTAIASYAKRNWTSVMKMKLITSVVAFVTVLASLIFFWGNLWLMGLGSLVGLGVLGYWAHTAIAYRKVLLESLMLDPSGGDQAAEDETE